ncbi:hypothetical protein GOC40_15225 [Sinorhizobium meliloti]|nr:hypothetical protein [Sinorhizobium meliloti]MDW9821155.1 hypothetical protein [Sinorhizobium meliloti]MDW9849631.1 hypothetical protein [Sinorhizobium meliloti]MDW9864577.1 hypothetical protein [Sinorhizobium meliloti]MDX0060106.1 hypothetical protein [Sinorhizobium meliloti]
MRVEGMVNGLREVITSVFEASNLLEQQRQGTITRQLAAWAAILAVPTAIAGIYGMNFEYMPELKTRYGYFAVLATIAGLCAFLFYRFKNPGGSELVLTPMLERRAHFHEIRGRFALLQVTCQVWIADVSCPRIRTRLPVKRSHAPVHQIQLQHQSGAAIDFFYQGGGLRGRGRRQPGVSQIFLVNGMLTTSVVERTDDSECHCREAEAPV